MLGLLPRVVPTPWLSSKTSTPSTSGLRYSPPKEGPAIFELSSPTEVLVLNWNHFFVFNISLPQAAL